MLRLRVKSSPLRKWLQVYFQVTSQLSTGTQETVTIRVELYPFSSSRCNTVALR